MTPRCKFRQLYSINGLNRGFTLIEVIVALAVLAIALSAIIKSTTENTANAGYLRDKTFASWVAVNKLTEVQVMADWPAIKTTSGSSEMAEQEWTWEMKVSATPDKNMRRIDLSVSLASNEDNVLTRLVGFVSKAQAK